MSAEVVTFPAMTEAEAERVTEQIAYRIDSITENYEVVMSLMRDALARNAHEALGYTSPGAYIADRFGRSLQTLGASLRREFVHELSDAGLSTRAIAPVFDVSYRTIARDVESPVTHVTPKPVEKMRPDEVAALMSSGFVETVDELAEVAGLTVNTRTGEVIEPTTTEHTFTERIKTVTGLDGKTYKRPEPKPVLTGNAAEQDSADTACREIGKALITLESFDTPQHRERVRTHWWPMGRDNIQPMHAALFTAPNIRRIAAALLKLADEMESNHA